MNLTDAESRIMPRSGGGGFEQSFSAQAAVDADSRLVVATSVVNTPVDAQQVEPMLERLAQLPQELGKVDKLLTDAGFFSAANVEHCERRGIVPYIARRRDQHYVPWYERRALPEPLPAEATPVQRMAHRLKTPEGRALYALRKQLPEPVFGIIKHTRDSGSSYCGDYTRQPGNGSSWPWPTTSADCACSRHRRFAVSDFSPVHRRTLQTRQPDLSPTGC